MNIFGFSSALYGWYGRYWMDYERDATNEEIFRDLVASGMTGVEIDADPETLNLLKTYGLSVSSAYIGLPLHEEGIDIEETVLPVARRLAKAGGRDLVINADPKGGWGVSLPKTDEEFRRQGHYLSEISEATKELGVRVSMHNHASDQHNADGDLRSVIKYATSNVGLCIDTGWAHVAGYKSAEWIRKYPDRIHAFHLRNQFGDVPSEGLFEGEINMKEILEAMKDVDFEGWLTLELYYKDDRVPSRTMIEDSKKSIEYLKNLALEIS